MELNKLGKLVEVAKGADRTLKEYERDSGVDAAIISKIINGKYVPQKPKIYRELTSPKAAPRGGVTYEQLLDAAEYSMSYKEGILAAEAAFATIPLVGPLATMGMAICGATSSAIQRKRKGLEKDRNSVSKNEIEKVTTDKFEEYHKNCQRFSATAIGILYGKLAQNGIKFRPGYEDELEFETFGNHAVVYLENNSITTWVFMFAAPYGEDEILNKFTKSIILDMMSNLVLLPADKKKKFSIVIDDIELYKDLMSYKGHNSYRGNLSIILVDTTEVSIEKEEYIATYDKGCEGELIKIVS